MSSRQEEKERRRQERLEREQAESKKAEARKRLQIAFGVVLGLAAVGAVVVALVAGGGDSSEAEGPTSTTASNTVPIPARKIADLDQAVKAAGCTYKEFPSEGREHIEDSKDFNGYKTNPPTSGTHRVTWAQDGIYDTASAPDKENVVHALEHGRIVYQYKPGTPARTIAQLETLFNEPLKGSEGYHQLVTQNTSGMQAAVAAVAWTRSVTCPSMNDKVFDAFRAFRDRFVDKGPEFIP